MGCSSYTPRTRSSTLLAPGNEHFANHVLSFTLGILNRDIVREQIKHEPLSHTGLVEYAPHLISREAMVTHTRVG